MLLGDVLALEGVPERMVDGGGQGHLDAVDGLFAGVGDAELDEDPRVDVGCVAPGRTRSFVDGGHALGDDVRLGGGVHDDTVGHPAGHPERAGTFRGDVDRQAAGGPPVLQDRTVEACLLAAGQGPDRGNRLLQQVDGGRLHPQAPDRAVAGAHPEDGPPAGQVVEGADGVRRDRRVPGDRIGHHRADAGPRRLAREQGQGDVGVPEDGVADADRCVAQSVAFPAQLEKGVQIVLPGADHPAAHGASAFPTPGRLSSGDRCRAGHDSSNSFAIS